MSYIVYCSLDLGQQDLRVLYSEFWKRITELRKYLNGHYQLLRGALPTPAPGFCRRHCFSASLKPSQRLRS